MSILNFVTKEMTLKVVYYGPGLCGKTTNLQYLHSILSPEATGKLLSLATETDRTLFFDFLPVALGKIKGFSVKIQLYTVPGQVYYNATRKLVLKGADAVIFVANSLRNAREENLESLQNMYENLMANNIKADEIPIILQYNKRDLPDIDGVEEINRYLNKKGYPYTEAIAVKGDGVEETFQVVTRCLIKNISKKHKIDKVVGKEQSIFSGVKKEQSQAPPQKQAVQAHEPQIQKKTTPPVQEDSIEEGSQMDVCPPLEQPTATHDEDSEELRQIDANLFEQPAESEEPTPESEASEGESMEPLEVEPIESVEEITEGEEPEALTMEQPQPQERIKRAKLLVSKFDEINRKLSMIDAMMSNMTHHLEKIRHEHQLIKTMVRDASSLFNNTGGE
jgi:hypothetical protein